MTFINSLAAHMEKYSVNKLITWYEGLFSLNEEEACMLLICINMSLKHKMSAWCRCIHAVSDIIQTANNIDIINLDVGLGFYFGWCSKKLSGVAISSSHTTLKILFIKKKVDDQIYVGLYTRLDVEIRFKLEAPSK